MMFPTSYYKRDNPFMKYKQDMIQGEIIIHLLSSMDIPVVDGNPQKFPFLSLRHGKNKTF